MRQTAKALFDFWNSFGLNAFPEDQIPDDLSEEVPNQTDTKDDDYLTASVVLPYITYQLIKPDWRRQISTYAKVYYHDTSYSDITNIIDSIESRIGEGTQLLTDSGFLLLFKDINFCQFMSTGDPAVKMAYLSLVMEAIT